MPDVAVLIVGMQQDASEDRNIEIVLYYRLFIIAIRQLGNWAKSKTIEHKTSIDFAAKSSRMRSACG
jgi:hypothetical protein